MTPVPIRVAFIARYHDVTLDRKVELLSKEIDLEVTHVCPDRWQDDYRVIDIHERETTYRKLTVPLLGKPTDPHHALFGSFAFGFSYFRPHIVHVEEEPDSITAMQIA